MKDISYKRLVMFGLIAALGLGLMPQNTSAAPQLAQNLLTNSDFEGSFVRSDSKTSVGQGWTAWWIPRPAGQPDWSYNQPDFIASAPCGSVCDHRIHTGGNAQRIFQYFGTYVAGAYQRVSVPQDADLRVTAFGQGWSSTTEQPQNVSNGGTHMHMKIGVDPQGGTNPLDPRVVWSGESDALDSWQQFQVFAHAQGTQVTVFLYAAPEDARRKNEVYWDDTDLEALSGDLAATAQASYPTPTSAPAVYTPTPISTALGQNLLTDGGFEGSLYIPCSRYDTVPWQHIPCDGLDFNERTKDGRHVNIMWNTVQVPLGWKAWWLAPNTNHADPNFYQNHPNNCYEDAPVDCTAWHNPEFRDTEKIVSGPPRIHSGQNSVKYFTFWSVHEAGLLQSVAVPPGSTVRFGAYMQAWSSNQDGREEFPNSYLSSGQTSMHMKVGIDPNGGEDPWSPNVVWSPEHDSYDQFGYYEVRAVAQGDKVTVFTHSMPEKGLKHNDMYVDDAELVLIDAGSAATSSSAQQPAAQAAQPAQQMPPAIVNAAPPPTALPRPDGAIVHVVTSGDTVFGLALQYKVPMDQILQLNGLTKDSLIHIGQELVIAAPPQAAAAPAPQNTATPPTDKASAAPPQVAIAKTSGKTLLCVRAYNDANADGLYSSGEQLVKGTVFAVSDQTGKSIVSYTSDGLSEPHCFSRLTPGTYIVSINPVPGATITSDREWSVQLEQGATVEVSFGSRLSSDALSQSSSSPDSSGLILFLVLIAAGVVGWAIYRRRSTGTGGLM